VIQRVRPARSLKPVSNACRYAAKYLRHPSARAGRRYAKIALLDLEAPDILGGRGIGRANQEGGEPSNVADVVALRLATEPSHLQVFD